jgi:pimeloyl-ACP methyl ester carboxylesterase
MTSDVQPQGPWRHREAVIDGLRFHYVEAGSGPLVVLLHGFPEFWYCWRHQLPALAAAGRHALAPDLRGYNLSDKPTSAAAYRIEELVADVAGLIRDTGSAKAAVVGHDWGGAVAWGVALRHPELVERLAVLNCPHPAAFRAGLRSPLQWLRSSYMLLFQLPLLPEWLIAAGDFASLAHTLRHDPARPDAYTADDIRRYKAALRRPKALTGGLNYYRAALWDLLRATEFPPLAVPALLIWGERDRYLGPHLADETERLVPGLRVERIAEASHWVQNDDPQRVNRLLVEFLTAPI